MIKWLKIQSVVLLVFLFLSHHWRISFLNKRLDEVQQELIVSKRAELETREQLLEARQDLLKITQLTVEFMKHTNQSIDYHTKSINILSKR